MVSREYDIIVMIVRLHKSETPQKAQEYNEIMTGGHNPAKMEVEKEGKKEKLIEPTYKIKVSDRSQMSFDLLVNEGLLPPGLQVGDVVRIRSLVASSHEDYKHTLVPTDHSNILHIRRQFMIYSLFKKSQETPSNTIEVKLDEPIMGKRTTPNTGDAYSTPTHYQEEVLEKQEIVSTIAKTYQSLPIVSL